jgi:bifunctional DNA-binding transcriptional regulator/antitoxin component of YhaV-PrlF toxin-antitoxin module
VKTKGFATMTIAIKNNNKTPLVVPASVRPKAGFRSGQEIEFKASGGVITILPKLPNADDEYTPEQRHTPKGLRFTAHLEMPTRPSLILSGN